MIKCDGITLHLLNILFATDLLIGWDGSPTLYLQLCRSGGASGKPLQNQQTKIVIVHEKTTDCCSAAPSTISTCRFFGLKNLASKRNDHLQEDVEKLRNYWLVYLYTFMIY